MCKVWYLIAAVDRIREKQMSGTWGEEEAEEG